MVPEILGFLIIAGALLVVVVRFISQRQKGVDTEELRESTEQLKAELTRSADAVIARMGNHIQHLESLLRQADERNVRMEAGINEYRRIAQELEDRSAALNQELSEARKTIAELKACQTMIPPQPAPQMMNMAVMPAAPVQERTDVQDFATVLQNSLNKEESDMPAINAQQAAGLAEAMNRRPEEIGESLVTETAEQEEAAETKASEKTSREPEKPISPNAAKAKALLRSGYSVEDTARETGMGRGAIELLREMNKRDLE